MTKQEKILIVTHGTKEILGIFNITFLGIYFLKSTNWNIISVSIYYIIYFAFHIVFFYLVGKFIKKDNIKKIYRLGIFFNFLAFIILFLMKENISKYIYGFAVFSALAAGLYWLPYQLFIYNFNKSNSMNSYFAFQQGVCQILNIIFILVLGSLITFGSYTYVFGILTILGITSYILSGKLDLSNYEQNKFRPLKYFNKLKRNKDSSIIYVYLSDFFDGISKAGALVTLLQLAIFLSVDREFELGYWSSIFGSISLISAYIINKKFSNKRIGKALIISAILINIATIPLLLNTNYSYLVMYNIIYAFCGPFIDILGESCSFYTLRAQKLEEYKKEHVLFREITLNLGRVMSYLTLIVSSILGLRLASMKILICVLSFAMILRALQFIKIEKNSENESSDEVVNESTLPECAEINTI